ncbi:hypothetical protein KAS41_03070 [Candidatus Parcubacteria bacterium]|nr:hypothetical protein [Candidatus Parcubacteria bacterium]
MNAKFERKNKNYKKCLHCDFLNPKNVKRCIKCGKKFEGFEKFKINKFCGKKHSNKINFSILAAYFKKLQQNPQYKPNAEESKEIAKVVLIIAMIIGLIIFMNIISKFN